MHRQNRPSLVQTMARRLFSLLLPSWPEFNLWLDYTSPNGRCLWYGPWKHRVYRQSVILAQGMSSRTSLLGAKVESIIVPQPEYQVELGLYQRCWSFRRNVTRKKERNMSLWYRKNYFLYLSNLTKEFYTQRDIIISQWYISLNVSRWGRWPDILME